MKGCLQIRVAAIFAGFTILSIFYLITNDDTLATLHEKFVQSKNVIDWSSKYLVYGRNCKIPNIDPFDDSIQHFIEPTAPVVCAIQPALSYIARKNGGNMLMIDQAVRNTYKAYSSHRVECCYSVVQRISQTIEKYNEDADRKYKVHNCEFVDKQVHLKNTTEFLIVRCQSIPRKEKSGKQVYENAHALTPIVPRVEKKIAYLKKIKFFNTTNLNQERLNVLIIGIDSVSRLSLRRTMPNTLRYLNKNNWIELNGYNKIADNTFPNLMAILTGKTVEQLHQECMLEHLPRMDKCPNLWKEFGEKGYVTAYAEDVPSISTFNYRMTGFVGQPTDYYMRPFMLAAHALLQVKNKDGLPICIGPKSAADYLFDYAKEFSTVFHENNFFGIFWLNSFSHNNVNAPGALDLRLSNLLKELKDAGVYENSVILVLSDHGIRFGDIRKTFVGFYEERLPFFFMHIPQSIIDKYPGSYQNLVTNSHRLTSPYDVYSTLRHLLDNDNVRPKGCPNCTSLFHQVPMDRKCEDASIETHWCMCPNFRQVQHDDPLVKKVSEFLFEHILKRTQTEILKEKMPSDMCAERSLKQIVRVHENEPHTKASSKNKIFALVIETEPYGLFEASIKVKISDVVTTFEVAGFISRLDSYLSTSKCVQSKMLQFYCHCTM